MGGTKQRFWLSRLWSALFFLILSFSQGLCCYSDSSFLFGDTLKNISNENRGNHTGLNDSLTTRLRDTILFNSDSKYIDTTSYRFDENEYRWGNFAFSDSLESDFRILSKLKGKQLCLKELQTMLNSIVSKRASTGFPFFAIKLLPTVSDKNIINCSIEAYNYDNPTYIDTIVIPHETKISKRYLLNYLDICEGELYNYTSIKSIESMIERLGFVSLNSSVVSRFSAVGAIIELPIEAKATGSFGGMVGFTTSQNDSRIMLTGDIYLNLINAFKGGEKINIVWSKSVGQSQKLNLTAELPYIFGTRIGVYTNLKINKIDTTMLVSDTDLAGLYHFKGLNNIRVGVSYKSHTFLTKSDTTIFDTRAMVYTGGFEYNTTDNFYNPSGGWLGKIMIGVGSRQQIGLAGTSKPLYTFHSTSTKFWRLSAKSVLVSAFECGGLFFDGNLWSNELFRIGGMNSVRGFDQESIYATHFGYFTAEYRYRFESRSHAFVFCHFGRYSAATVLKRVDSFLVSSGLGVVMDTGAGVFSIAYALGKSTEQPLRLKSAKVHFGYLYNF